MIDVLLGLRELLVRGTAVHGADETSDERDDAGATQRRRLLQRQLDAQRGRCLQRPRHPRWLPTQRNLRGNSK